MVVERLDVRDTSNRAMQWDEWAQSLPREAAPVHSAKAMLYSRSDAEAHLSLGSRHTRLQRLRWKRVNVDSSLHSTLAQSSFVQLAWS